MTKFMIYADIVIGSRRKALEAANYALDPDLNDYDICFSGTDIRYVMPSEFQAGIVGQKGLSFS